MVEYIIAVALLKDGRLSDVRKFTGTREECIAFINESQRTMLMEDFFRSQFVVDLAYSEESDVDVDIWYTLDQLAEMGAIEL